MPFPRVLVSKENVTVNFIQWLSRMAEEKICFVGDILGYFS